MSNWHLTRIKKGFLRLEDLYLFERKNCGHDITSVLVPESLLKHIILKLKKKVV
jgi:hypothetical protein